MSGFIHPTKAKRRADMRNGFILLGIVFGLGVMVGVLL